MDGVPPITQQPVKAGNSFGYDFIAPRPPGPTGSIPHTGVQLDRGLYGALIVEDPPAEPGRYDDEWVIVLDDWLDGVTATPDKVLKELSAGMAGMGGMGDMFMRMGNTLMGATSDILAGDAGDVYYPYYLINGKPPADPSQFTGRPGDRIRLRIINAGSDTAFRLAIGGHALTITHTDGFPPVDPVEVDSILIGMGERYDALLTLGDGVFPLVAQAEGKRDRGFALIRTADATPPDRDVALPPELSSKRIGTTARVGTAAKLTASKQVVLSERRPDREISIPLTGSMEAYDWAINEQRFDMSRPPLGNAYEVRSGGTSSAHGDEQDHDVAPIPPAWPHVPALRQRATQGHLDHPAREKPHGRFRRGQPGALGRALPQPLPRRVRNDDRHRLFELTPRQCHPLSSSQKRDARDVLFRKSRRAGPMRPIRLPEEHS